MRGGKERRQERQLLIGTLPSIRLSWEQEAPTLLSSDLLQLLGETPAALRLADTVSPASPTGLSTLTNKNSNYDSSPTWS